MAFLYDLDVRAHLSGTDAAGVKHEVDFGIDSDTFAEVRRLSIANAAPLWKAV